MHRVFKDYIIAVYLVVCIPYSNSAAALNAIMGNFAAVVRGNATKEASVIFPRIIV